MPTIAEQTEDNRAELRGEIQKALSGREALELDEPAGFQNVGFVFGNEVPSTINVTEYLKAAVGWVYGCVSAISDAVAQVEFQLFKIENGEVVKVEEHAVLDLLYRVNDFQTQYDHLCLTQSYLELTGEAPWFVDRGNSGTGEPTSIMLIRPDKLKIKKAPAGSAAPVGGYVYEIEPGSNIDISTDEMIFLKYPDPNNMFRGKGTLAAAAVTVDVDNYSEEYNKRFFFNSARPDTILSSDQKLTPKQREELRASIKRVYQGKENAHKTLIMESGMKWGAMSPTAKDMDFLEQQKFSMAKILSIFRVPKPIIAVSDDVNYANAKIAEYVFAKWTIKPKLTRIVAQLNEFFLPMFSGTEGMFLSFEDPTPEDVDAKIKKYDSGLGRGYMTLNEVRGEEGLDEIGEEGDVLYIPNNLVPPGTPPAPSGFGGIKVARKDKSKFRSRARKAIENSGGGYVAAKNRVKKIADKEKKAEEKVAEVGNKIDQFALAMAKTMMRGQWKDKKERIEDEQEAERKKKMKEFGESFIKAADNFEKQFIATTKEQFARELSTILNKAPKKAVDLDDFLLDEEDESQLLVRVYTPQVRKVIKERGDAAGVLAGVGDDAFDELTKPVQAYIKKRVFRFSFEMTKETNKLLSGTLKEGIAAGESIVALRDRVKVLFDGMEKYRAERIARSEVVRASNFAARQAYIQSGVVKYMEWLTTNDDATCPYCAPLDGKRVKPSDSFFDKGDTQAGDDGTEIELDYEIIEHPPLHVNCRCTIVPIVK